MLLTEEIRIRAAEGTWVVLAGDAVIGESRRALELSEPDQASVIYFPREDIAMALLDPSATASDCPVKGRAEHFHIATRDGVIADAGWSYPEPGPEARRLAGHVAFARGKVALKQG